MGFFQMITPCKCHIINYILFVFFFLLIWSVYVGACYPVKVYSWSNLFKSFQCGIRLRFPHCEHIPPSSGLNIHTYIKVKEACNNIFIASQALWWSFKLCSVAIAAIFAQTANHAFVTLIYCVCNLPHTHQNSEFSCFLLNFLLYNLTGSTFLKMWCSTLSLYEGRKRQLMCSSWKFCVVLFTTERSATLTRKKKTPLKLKSRQRSSQVRRDSLSNKHSMTNPFSQMARPSHLLHKEWSQSIRLQSETTTPTWVMELQFWEKDTRSTKQTLQRLLKASWDKALPQWPLMCCTAPSPQHV